MPAPALSSPSGQSGSDGKEGILLPKRGRGEALPMPGLLDYGNHYVGVPVGLVTQRLEILFVCYKSTYPGRRQKYLAGGWDPQAL